MCRDSEWSTDKRPAVRSLLQEQVVMRVMQRGLCCGTAGIGALHKHMHPLLSRKTCISPYTTAAIPSTSICSLVLHRHIHEGVQPHQAAGPPWAAVLHKHNRVPHLNEFSVQYKLLRLHRGWTIPGHRHSSTASHSDADQAPGSVNTPEHSSEVI